METVLYRRQKVLVNTIPKGTLLFRISPSPRTDIRGIPKKDGTRCILPNHNVYFYPNPFVAKLMLGELTIAQQYDMVHVFILKHDVKVFWLLKPSKFRRVDRTRKRFFLKSCKTIKQGCLDKVYARGLHAAYNPCVSDTIIKKYPDIVGMVAIAYRDAGRLEEKMSEIPASVKPYFNFATDAGDITSIPELSLHPLRQRPSTDVIVRQGDHLDTNYKELGTFEIADTETLLKFMQKHAVYNPDTFFYKYKP